MPLGEFPLGEFLVDEFRVGEFLVGEKDGVSSSLFPLLPIGFPDPCPGFNLGEKETFPSCLLLWGLALKGLGVIKIKMGMGKTPT
jgi:hypothetical protein